MRRWDDVQGETMHYCVSASVVCVQRKTIVSRIKQVARPEIYSDSTESQNPVPNNASHAVLAAGCFLDHNFVQLSTSRCTCILTVRNGPSRSPKVINFGTNQKRVHDFLLVINSNLGRILPRFRDIEGFLLRTLTHPYSTRILGAFPLDEIVDVVALRSEDPKLIIRVINFELVQPICPRYIIVTDGQTDGCTDDLR